MGNRQTDRKNNGKLDLVPATTKESGQTTEKEKEKEREKESEKNWNKK